MKRRLGFTLLEISIALVITALVVSLAYAASQAGIDTEARLEGHRSGGESMTSARVLLGDALRHAVPGYRGGPPAFEIVRRTSQSGDSLVFVTRGIVPPLGTSALWRATLFVTDGALRFEASPQDSESQAPGVTAAVNGVSAMSVFTLGRGLDANWNDQWPDPSVAPQAVKIHLSNPSSSFAGDLEPIIVRIGLERVP